MDLNSVVLNKKFLASLYKNNLIYLNYVAAGDKEKIDFLGNNEKGIIFLVKDAANKFLDESQWKFFNDLLNACQLTVADVAVINFYHNPISYEEIKQQFNPSKLLIFGVDSSQIDLPFNIPGFQVQNYSEQTLMLCPALAEIQKDKELKKQLWSGLQKIFNLQKQK